MPAVIKKPKQKNAKKALPAVKEKKFVSESLQKPKPGLKKHTKQKRRGVVYIKHLPHGFLEEQLRGYFSQFGAITRLRLARSTRTLGSKGYAFIEFRYPEVAEIAADAMNNYLMFKQIVKTRFIPPSEIKYDYFRSGVSRIKVDGKKMLTSKTIQAREAVIKGTNRLMTDNDQEHRLIKIGSKIQKSKQKLAALGIDFDVDETAANMGEEVMKAAEQAKPKTIENLELDSEDEADETFDPASVDIESGDEFEDFEYASGDDSEDDDGLKLEEAIVTAKAATSKDKIELPVATNSKEKRATKPAAAAKLTKNGKENKSVEAVEPKLPKRKAAAKAKEVATEQLNSSLEGVMKTSNWRRTGKNKAKSVIESNIEAEAVPVKKTKKAAAPKEPKTPVVKEKKPTKKSVVELKTLPTVSKPQSTKAKKGSPTNKKPAETTEPLADDASLSKGAKGKKAQKSKPVESPEPKKNARRAGKKVPEPQESPAQLKTKKIAKTSKAIEKKEKPVKAAETKLKKAAAVAVSSGGAELVKLVKGKEVKGKKKAAAKK